MPRQDVTRLLAENWASLPHEDGRPRRLMHMSQFAAGGDAKAQQAVHQLGIDIGDCVQTLLERNGYTLIHRDDPKPADAEGYKVAKLKCLLCGKQLYTFGVDANMTANLGALAVKTLTQLEHQCQT